MLAVLLCIPPLFLGYGLNRLLVAPLTIKRESDFRALDMLKGLGEIWIYSLFALSIEAGLTAETALIWLMVGIGFQLRTIELYRN